MQGKEYQEKALKTNNADYDAIKNRLVKSDRNNKFIDLLHAGIGLTTECGEFMDTIKKYVFYGKKIDEVNLVEEIGDIMWYCAIALDSLDSSFEEVYVKNIDKLIARYPNKFTNKDALNRNLDKEREILEK